MTIRPIFKAKLRQNGKFSLVLAELRCQTAPKREIFARFGWVEVLNCAKTGNFYSFWRNLYKKVIIFVA